MATARQREFLEADPATLHLPTSRLDGADPVKLARQISRHSDKVDGMPPVLVVRCKDDKLQIIDGVTRATRVAKLRPGELIPVEVIDTRPKRDVSAVPRVAEKLT